MPETLISHLQTVSEGQIPRWIEGWEYNKAVLNKGAPIPWADIGALVAHFKQGQSLLNSDVITLPLGEFFNDSLTENNQLIQMMASKNRLSFALKTWLGNQNVRQQLLEIVSALTDTFPNTPLVISIPSPRVWLGLAHCKAKGINDIEVTWDDAETASMFVADFLRCFANTSISGVLLVESPSTAPQDVQDINRYKPVINVAQNYQWSVGIQGIATSHCASITTSHQDQGNGLDFIIVETETKGGGHDTSATLWANRSITPLKESLFYYIAVPANQDPDDVQQKLGSLNYQLEATPA